MDKIVERDRTADGSTLDQLAGDPELDRAFIWNGSDHNVGSITIKQI